MKIGNLLAACAAVTLVALPVAAEAGTSASLSPLSVGSLSTMGERSSTSVSKDQAFAPGLWVVFFLAAGAGGYGLYKAFKKDKKSNGAS